MKNFILSLFAMVILAGCTTLYTHAVTLTKIRDSAMKELAVLSVEGKLTAETDARIAKADLAYRQAAEVAAKALKAYQAGGSVSEYAATLQAVKAALAGVLDILAQFIPASETAAYNNQLVKASKL